MMTLERYRSRMELQVKRRKALVKSLQVCQQNQERLVAKAQEDLENCLKHMSTLQDAGNVSGVGGGGGNGSCGVGGGSEGMKLSEVPKEPVPVDPRLG